MGNSAIRKALLAHRTLIMATVAAATLIVYATPIAYVINGTAFAAKGGGDGKPPKPHKPPGGGDEEHGDYGHTVKPPKPHK